jgi:hypothetical protein
MRINHPMSTIDPRVTRIQSQDVVVTGSVAGWLAAFLGILHGLVWAVAALSTAATLDIVRALIVDAGHGDDALQMLAGWPAVVLALLGLMLGGGVHGAAERVTSEAASAALRFATALLGLSAGLIAYAPRWTPPRTLGMRGPYWGGGERQRWGLLEWMAYWAPVWLPALVGVFAAVSTTMAAVLIIRRIHLQRQVADILANGVHTNGHVTDVRSAPDADKENRHVVRFAVTYWDTDHTQRWIEKVMRLPEDEIPLEGAQVDVWYDDARPGDPNRVAVDVRDVRRPKRAVPADDVEVG